MKPSVFTTIAAWALGAGLVGPAFAADPSSELVKRGEAVFANRCSVCHGAQADGRSALAEVMAVKPANLRASLLSEDERRAIVSQGGVGVGRSPNMPAWKDELGEADLAAVLAFAATLTAEARQLAAKR
jgi:mono/diheme cytochrome c family protein